jgi:hypothetical protein
MARAAAEQQQELQDLVASRRGYRSWFTQAVRKAENIANTALGPLVNRSQLMQNRIEEAMAELDRRYAALNECLQNMYARDATDNNAVAIIKDEDRYNQVNKRLLVASQEAGGQQHQAAAIIPQVNGFKPIQDLKPFTLMFDNTPSELNDWIDRFTSYCKASQITTQPVEQQQAFL